MNKPTLIGVGFRKQQGKDTFADMLVKYLFKAGAIVHRESFATNLKKEVANEWPRYAHLIDGGEEGRNLPIETDDGTTTMRQLLQDWGMQRRVGDPDYWLNIVLARHPPNRKRRPEFVVISDCRFPNELDAMDRCFAVRRRGYLAPPDTHESENALTYEDPRFEAVIENEFHLGILELHADIVAKALISGRPLPNRKPGKPVPVTFRRRLP